MDLVAPRVWVLLGRHAGDNAQLLGLATALGWPFEPRRIVFNRLAGVPSLLLGPSRLGMARVGSDPLEPPWPDLVLVAGFRGVSVARWIRRRSGGRARLVAVGRPRAPLGFFDQVITTAQYGLPRRANVQLNRLTLNRPDPERMKAAAERWFDLLAHLPRPWTALLVGGDTKRRRVDVEWAQRLADMVEARRQRTGGSLFVTTSPRTPAVVADVLQARLAEPRHLFRWRADADNPYAAYLAMADAFVVTGDSASMLSEACWTGKPVLYFAPADAPHAAPPRLLGPLVSAGLLTPERDMAAFRASLAAGGLAHPLAAQMPPPPLSSTASPPDFDTAVQRIRALFPAAS